MELYITKSGFAFKVSTYEAGASLQPWIIDHPRYKMGMKSACMLIAQSGMEYVQFELNALKRKRYSEMTMFERGVYSEVEHYRWCVENNRKYYTLSR